MPRLPRIERIGLHHVLDRGVEKRNIFLDDGDNQKFIRLIEEMKIQFNFEVLVYCLMGNHYHLLVRINEVNLSLIMKQLNHAYTLYFNRKYGRVGTLWQGRYTEKYVHDEKYLEVLMKYIEQNPIRAGFCSRIGEYPWASALTKTSGLGIDELRLLAEFRDTQFRKPAPPFQPVTRRPLVEYLNNVDRNQGILTAVRAGYMQIEIAKALNLSNACISRIVRSKTVGA
ncbi:MAG: transposase [Spirochaetota bacterium]